MIRLFTEVLKTLPRRWPVEWRYLIGVSGGRDSVALLRGLAEAGYGSLTVCHLDHGLRGAASDGDAKFVRNLAGDLGFAFETARAEVAAEAGKAGISLETAGRRARFGFFLECAERLECPRVFLAHHADDQAETMLMNLCRGTAGLHGMAEETRMTLPGFCGELQLLRPLLTVRREDLTSHAAARGWSFREDASNASPEFVRNRVRNELLPLLRDIFKRDAAPAILRTALLSADAAGFLESAAREESQAERLAVSMLRAQPEALQRGILRQWLKQNGVPDLSLAHVEAVRGMLNVSPAGPAKINLPGNRFVRRSRGFLWMEPPGSAFQSSRTIVAPQPPDPAGAGQVQDSAG